MNVIKVLLSSQRGNLDFHPSHALLSQRFWLRAVVDRPDIGEDRFQFSDLFGLIGKAILFLGEILLEVVELAEG